MGTSISKSKETKRICRTLRFLKNLKNESLWHSIEAVQVATDAISKVQFKVTDCRFFVELVNEARKFCLKAIELREWSNTLDQELNNLIRECYRTGKVDAKSLGLQLEKLVKACLKIHHAMKQFLSEPQVAGAKEGDLPKFMHNCNSGQAKLEAQLLAGPLRINAMISRLKTVAAFDPGDAKVIRFHGARMIRLYTDQVRRGACGSSGSNADVQRGSMCSDCTLFGSESKFKQQEEEQQICFTCDLLALATVKSSHLASLGSTTNSILKSIKSLKKKFVGFDQPYEALSHLESKLTKFSKKTPLKKYTHNVKTNLRNFRTSEQNCKEEKKIAILKKLIQSFEAMYSQFGNFLESSKELSTEMGSLKNCLQRESDRIAEQLTKLPKIHPEHPPYIDVNVDVKAKLWGTSSESEPSKARLELLQKEEIANEGLDQLNKCLDSVKYLLDSAFEITVSTKMMLTQYEEVLGRLEKNLRKFRTSEPEQNCKMEKKIANLCKKLIQKSS